jgi:DNA-directed RNA polymerase subunit omega
VHLAARRSREINSYYHSLGEGLGRFTPPLVDRVESNKPLSIALEEVAQGKIVSQEPGEAMRVAEQLLGGEEAEGDADVVSLDLEAGGAEEGPVADEHSAPGAEAGAETLAALESDEAGSDGEADEPDEAGAAGDDASAPESADDA